MPLVEMQYVACILSVGDTLFGATCAGDIDGSC